MAFNKTILTRAIRDVIKPKKLSKPKDVEFNSRYAKDLDTSSNFKKLSVKVRLSLFCDTQKVKT